MLMLTLQQMQEAAKLIEIDGKAAYHTSVSRFGPEVAQLLLVAHLRRVLGAMDSSPSNPEIDGLVIEHLRKLGLLEQFSLFPESLRVLTDSETEYMCQKTGNQNWGRGD